MVNWSTSCIFNTNVLNSYRSVEEQYLLPADSTEQIVGNTARINDPEVFELVTAAKSMDQSEPEFVTTGQEIFKEVVQDMQYINMMNIPTTIPTNDTYWTNFPKQENAYAVPYTWWSSFKKILTNITPAGQ
jgi:peptide/nickel transport system substrate-binding protein